MAEITEVTSIEELAVIISEALEDMSHDLDFVTSADPKNLLRAIAPLGFVQGSTKRLYEHPRCHCQLGEK